MSCQNPGIFRDYTVKQGINFIEIDLHAGDEIPDLNIGFQVLNLQLAYLNLSLINASTAIKATLMKNLS